MRSRSQSAPNYLRTHYIRRKRRSGSAADLLDDEIIAGKKRKDIKRSMFWNYITHFSILFLAAIFIISVPTESSTLTQYVWYYGWITALSTGIGALPFAFITELDSTWLGISNGIAAGMMIAASVCLVGEGVFCENELCQWRTIFGFLIGVAFITYTKNILDQYEDLKLGSLDGLDAKKALLMVGVMTLHSFSEGVGIGVSFGGKHGEGRGLLISTTLAIHNVPEGLAISLVLVPKGVSFIRASIWSIISSLPQPIMAVIAFLFVEEFTPILPVGLGFAGGAMGYVALFELLIESYEDTNSIFLTGISVLVSTTFMLLMHGSMRD